MRNWQPVAAAARTGNGNSAPFRIHTANLSLILLVTAASGTTPSLTLAVHWSSDGQTFVSAQPVDAFTALTAAGGAAKAFQTKAPIARLVWAISGTTPSFTFSVDASTY